MLGAVQNYLHFHFIIFRILIIEKLSRPVQTTNTLLQGNDSPIIEMIGGNPRACSFEGFAPNSPIMESMGNELSPQGTAQSPGPLDSLPIDSPYRGFIEQRHH